MFISNEFADWYPKVCCARPITSVALFAFRSKQLTTSAKRESLTVFTSDTGCTTTCALIDSLIAAFTSDTGRKSIRLMTDVGDRCNGGPLLSGSTRGIPGPDSGSLDGSAHHFGATDLVHVSDLWPGPLQRLLRTYRCFSCDPSPRIGSTVRAGSLRVPSPAACTPE